ncbi:hypothetical protein B8V81_2505 [Paenibacillus pasadenensis]|uniref:Uncharacterized protein n=1 Tax=Paenibacillus pasadenensis TaxID=217090 RepID=A0A2N5N157_9BACL|nr:hypothetical protein B8V81_2505 [Paenibacillus pasadenensis]
MSPADRYYFGSLRRNPYWTPKRAPRLRALPEPFSQICIENPRLYTNEMSRSCTDQRSDHC